MEGTYSFKVQIKKNYRVLSELRAVKDKAYTPLKVSLGPLHRDNPDLQNMEKEKRRYMSSFFDRLVNSIKGKGQIIRESSHNSGHIYGQEICVPK